MKSLCIKTNDSRLLDYLLNELKTIELHDVCFSCNKFKYYKNIIIHYTGDDYSLFFSKIASLLSFLVIDELEESFLQRLLMQNYFYFNKIEQDKILDICFDVISEDFTNIFTDKFDKIYNSFLEFISTNKTLYLSGFINFRMKAYIEVLDNIVCEAVNTYIIEKEYLEFISLLKLYINSQPNNSELVHLIYSPSDTILLDKDKNIINNSLDISDFKYLSDITFSNNDYILNSLLTLLPKKIYIHLINRYIDEFINTLQLVFENRIIICSDCNICKLYKIEPYNKSKHINKK